MFETVLGYNPPWHYIKIVEGIVTTKYMRVSPLNKNRILYYSLNKSQIY